MVIPHPTDDLQHQARSTADHIAAEGRRVLLLAQSDHGLRHQHNDCQPAGAGLQLPRSLVPMALVVLAERIRDDAEQTLRFFTEQGVTLKVISGDNPRTVGAVAAKVGVPGVSSVADAVDARELPDDVDQLADLLETHSAFGRVSPHQKAHDNCRAAGPWPCRGDDR